LPRGRSHYFALYKNGRDISRKKRQKNIKNTKGYNYQHITATIDKCTFHILEVFMRTILPIEEVRQNEIRIVNLDNIEEPGIGWRSQRVEIVLFISIVLAIFDRRENWYDI